MAVRMIKKTKAVPTTKAKAKGKAKAQPKVTPLTSLDPEVAAQVDKLGEINEVLAPAKKTVTEQTKLWKPVFGALQDHVDATTPPGEEASLVSENYALAFGAHGNMTSLVNPHKAFELLEGVKEGLAWELMGFGITELRKYLTPAQFEEVTDTNATKARSVKVTKLE